MTEVDDAVAMVLNDRSLEGDGSDAAQIPEGAPLAERRAVRLPVIGNVDVERECAFRPDVAAVVDLRHDLVAVVQSRALDSELVRRHRETHEGRRACGLALRLSELRNLVELAYARLLGAASPADRHKCAAGRPRWHSGEGNEAAASIHALLSRRFPIARTHGRVTFQTSSMSVPELRPTLEIGQKRSRSAFPFSLSASRAPAL